MEINIPRNLMGSAGDDVGGAMMNFGTGVSRAGAALGAILDNIQANVDYNDSVAVTGEWEVESDAFADEFTQRDDGSDLNKAKTEYLAGQQKITDRYLAKVKEKNWRVSAYTKKYVATRGIDRLRSVNRALMSNFVKRSIKTDEDQAQISIGNALRQDGDTLENVTAAIEDSRTKIMARAGIYGEENAEDVFKGAIAKSLHDNFALALEDSRTAKNVVVMMKDPANQEKILNYVPPNKRVAFLSILKTAGKEVSLSDGMSIGTEIFKNDTTGSLEAMTDQVREREVDTETTKAAVQQIKELYSMRHTDEQKRAQDAADTANKILNPIALKRNGINYVSDLTPEQWAALERDNPQYAKQLQDNMRRELDYKIRQNTKEAREARQEKRLIQAENEEKIMLGDNFRTRDLRSDLATGNISAAQFNRLTGIQDKMNPLKIESVKAALAKVNTGGALSAALRGLDKNDEATWKLKYSELIKTFAENNIDDPNFDQKLNDFMEKYVLSDMVTYFMKSRGEERTQKYETAKEAAGHLRKKYTQEDLEYTARQYGITVEEVKRRLGVQ